MDAHIKREAKMGLQLLVDTLDAVPEEVRSLYAEQDGKFRLQVEGVEESTALKKALENSRRVEREVLRKVTQWEALGKTPEEIQELLEAQRKAEEDKLNKAGEWDKLKAQMNEKHQAELEKHRNLIKERDDSVEKMRQTLHRHMIDSEATRAIAEAKGVPALLLPHVQKNVRVLEEGDAYKVQIVDAKGDPRINGKGEPLTITDLVGEMRQSDVFGRAFDGTGRTGSGMPPNGAGGAGGKSMSRTEFEKLPALERAGVLRSGVSLTD